MILYRSLPRLALRRMRRNWRLLSSVAAGTLIAAAILAATAIYADAIRDLGLTHALAQRDPATLDVTLLQSNVPVAPNAYQESRLRQDAAVAAAFQGAAGGVTRQIMSATFFPTAPGGTVDSGDADRPRSNILVRTDLDSQVRVLEGAYPAEQPDAAEVVEVLVGARTAAEHGIAVGEEFDLHPFWDPEATPLRIRVTGTAEEVDSSSRYWGIVEERLDARERSWPTFRFFVPEATLFGAIREAVPTIAADYRDTHQVLFDRLDARNATAVAAGLERLPATLEASERSVQVTSVLAQVLRTFDQKLFFTRIPLLVLLLQIGAIVAYYLVMVSTMLVERQAAEIATMRSRGATTFQLLAIYGVEGTVLATAAAAVGPPIAATVIGLLGATPAFSALSGGDPLTVHIGGTAYILAGIGAGIAFCSLMIPAWRVTRSSVVEFKRSVARPSATPLFLRYYLDVVLVLAVAAVFWRLSQQEELFTESVLGETNVDPLLLATPAVFMVTVGIVFLRLFPLVLRGIAWLVGWTRSVAILVGMRSLVRQPSHYTRLILLLMFATGVGMFGATFSATLGKSYEDRAGFQAGADVRARLPDGMLSPDPETALAALDGVPHDGASLAVRTSGGVLRAEERSSYEVDILAVDPATFGQVAYTRPDFAPEPLDVMLATLGASSVVPLGGPTLPEDAAQLGVWLKFEDVRGRVTVAVALRDATGRMVNRTIANGLPDEESGQWRLYTTDFHSPGGRQGDPLVAPVEVTGISFEPQGRIAQQRGIILLGPLLTTTEPYPTLSRGTPVFTMRTSAWADATAVTEFDADSFQVLQGVRQNNLDDALLTSQDAPPGAAAALRYEWTDSRFSPSLRGLRLRVPGDEGPAPIYLSRDAASYLGIEVGEPFTVTVGRRYITATLAGLLDYFPTHEVASGDGFAFLDASRLLSAVNGALPDNALTINQVWLATDDPVRTIVALEEAGASEVVGREALQFSQQDDPLVAAGWTGILGISFGAVLLLSAIGFIVYSYLTAQQRGLEFAILRTLGFSRPQIFSVVMFEHLFVIVAGMGLGTLVGLRVGQIMMGFLATDETGAAVTPPFILGVSWTQVFVVWGILGAVFVSTIAAVVALYFRLAVHRVLRIGDA